MADRGGPLGGEKKNRFLEWNSRTLSFALTNQSENCLLV